MAEKNIRVGNISAVSGEVSIAGGDIYKGFTAEQVSVLIQQITTTFEIKKFEGHSPYKGLDVFKEEDAELFFGREKLVDNLLKRVQEFRTVFIGGPSGSGKSSLVRAGLIPALKTGKIKNSDQWLYVTMKPGREPIHTLARAVAALVMSTNAEDEIRAKAMTDETIFARWCEIALNDESAKRVVLFIDQFEEVFTQISREEERVAFLNMLTHAAAVENGRVIILFSMRSDFVSNCAMYPKLNALLNQQFVQIGAMQPDELVSAIAQPALSVGLRIDPDLIAQIINDMQGEPGALPLMQFALKDLFDSQNGNDGVLELTRAAYIQRGGIHKALERHADQTFAGFTVEEQELTRSVFSGLIEIGRGTEDTRRTANFDELIPVNVKSDSVQAIVHKLADARLITTDEVAGKDTVTISHEKLIDAWPWLKKLVNENRDVIALQNEIVEDAKEWDEHQRDTSYLYSGARLATAQEKIKLKSIVLSDLAQAFVEKSIQKEESERSRQLKAQQARRNLLVMGTALVVSITLLIAAVAAGLAALRQSQRALASQLAAQSTILVNKQPDLAFLLSLEANHIGDELGESDPIWLGSLITSLNGTPKLGTYLRAHNGDVRAVAFSPDGHWLATVGGLPSGNGGEVFLWDMTSTTADKPYQIFTTGGQRLLTAAFSSDGKQLVTAGDDKNIYVFDPQNCCQPVHTWPVENKVRALAFVTLDSTKYIATGEGNRVNFWNVANGRLDESQTLTLPGIDPSVRILSVAVTQNNSMLVAGSDDGNVTVWDLNTHKLRFQQCSYGNPQTNESTICHQSGQGNTDVRGLAFSPDGKLLASGSSDTRAWLWDVSNGTLLAQTPPAPEGGHTNTVASIAFDPTSQRVVTASWDNTVRTWDLKYEQGHWKFQLVDLLTGHSNSVWGVSYSPDGKWLASGSSDKSVILWNTNQVNQIGVPFASMSPNIWGLATSPDRRQLAAADENGHIQLWNFDGHVLTKSTSFTHPGGVLNLAYSHDGKLLASAGYDHTIRVWDVHSGQLAGQIENAHDDQIWAVMFSPNDKWLASASYDSTAKIWDTTTYKEVGTPLVHEHDQVFALTFNNDGTRLLVSGSGPNIYQWDVSDPASFKSLDPLRGHIGQVNALAFNPAYPSLLASVSDDKTLLVWNMNLQEHIRNVMGIKETMDSVAFSPDGNRIASGTDNNTILLWQLDSQHCSQNWSADTCVPSSLGDGLIGHTTPVEKVVFLSDTALVSSSADGQLILWDLDKSHWYQRACAIVHRSLDDFEYQQYIQGKINPTLLHIVNWFSSFLSSGAEIPQPACIPSLSN